MAQYVYPAIFLKEADGGYSVTFPDVPGAITEGKDMEDALNMANDALCLMLYHAETRGEKLPKATPFDSIRAGKNEFVQFVSCDTGFYKRFYQKRAVRKTITIPSYLNALAERQNVNFSATLQEALKQKLQA